MTSPLHWVTAMPRQLVRDGRECRGCSNNHALEKSSRCIRLLKDNVGKGSSQFKHNLGGRRAALADGAQKHLQDGSALKDAVGRSKNTREGRRMTPSNGPLKLFESRSALNDAIVSINSRVNQGITIDSRTYVDLLQGCFKQKDLELVKQMHDCIKKSGLEHHPYVASNLLKCYIGCGRLQNARELFNKLMNKDIVIWTIMIGGYATHGQAEDAIEVYKQLREEGAQPTEVTYLNALKACASSISLKWGKNIHAHIVHDGYQADMRLCNALVHMYAKCGSVEDARLVFDRMVDRNIVSWNVMIGGLAQHGNGHEAFSLFHQMQKEGFTPNSITYLNILNATADPKDLPWVKEVHSHAAQAGLARDVCVNTALIHMYAKCGSMDDAKLVFERMVNRDIISWNAMIGALAQEGRGHEAFSLFNQMQGRGGVVPNAGTYMSILNANACEGALVWVKEIHRHAARSRLDADVRIGNALVRMYAKSGSIEDARAVFDRMGVRDVISWNGMIGGLTQHGLGHEAYSVFLQMQREGFTPDPFTYVNILNPCSSRGALEWVKEVHAYAAKAGLDVDLRVASALVHMYAESGSIKDARAVFDRMEQRNIVSWNIIIGGLAQHGLGQEAFSLFVQMEREGFVPDSLTYVSILNPCSNTGALVWVKEVHAHARKAGLDTDVRVGNALVHMYSKSGSIEDARVVFDRMRQRDVISWNVMIGGLAQHGFGLEALSLFHQMQKEEFTPNTSTYLNILNPCSSTDALEWVREVHAHAVKAGLDMVLRVGNALVHMYAKSGSIEDAKLVFDRMEERDVITWNTMIGALAQQGLGHEAMSLFRRMEREGFVPNSLTYVNILNPSKSTCALETVQEVHAHATKAGLDGDVLVGTALVNMYAKIGSIDDARQVFDKMLDRDVVTWTVMIGGLGQHGRGREALQLYEEMKIKGKKPTGPLFVAVLSACSHAGLVDESRFQFVSMTRDYGIEPALEHYNCFVDSLGRGGQLEEAMLFILEMPIKPNEVTWGALLGNCRTYNNIKLAEIAAEESLKLDPMDTSPYVLLSNMYAAVGNWDQASSVRSMMDEKGIRKDAGRCWIEVDNKIHYFTAGDISHPETKEIHATLNGLSGRLKAQGYMPDTRLVLRKIDEEDKQSALCTHSERLAIAYGLMHVAPGKPIRIYKNLRICSDCHTASKLISEITGQEIVARDANRFHLFKNGSCSCGDYW